MIKYYFIIALSIVYFINRDQIERDDSCRIKLKVTLLNIVIKGGFGRPAISKLVLALHEKPLTFVAEGWILHRR